MLVGLRKQYIENLPQKSFESNVVYMVESTISEMVSTAQEWMNYWQTILRLFNPELNNVYLDGAGGDIKVNRVFSSEPGTFMYETAAFLQRGIFPKQTPWFRGQFEDRLGRPIDKSKVSISSQRFSNEGVEVIRHLLSKGKFYDSSEEFLLHYELLGTATMHSLQSRQGISYMHLPVHRVPVLRSTENEVIGICKLDAYKHWEILRDYGEEGLRLFEKPAKDMYQAAQWDGRQGLNMPYVTMGTHMPGATTGQQTLGRRRPKDKEVLRLYIPNKEWMGVPGIGSFMPEMEYICFVLTRETKRLLDVWSCIR